MITITNEKVAGFEPCWASYKGFSLLFDNPDKVLSPMEHNERLHKINCALDNNSMKLYKAFADALDKIGRDLLTNTYLFCPLPSYSYHVTVWDGINDGNVNELPPSSRTDFEFFLKRLPPSLLDSTMVSKFPSLLTPGRTITFKFDKLSKWGNNVLVARLKADDTSEANLNRLKADRKNLTAQFQKLFGFLFSVALKYQDLNNQALLADLRKEFEKEKISLSQNVTVEGKDGEWRITDEDNTRTYLVKADEDKLNIYSNLKMRGSYDPHVSLGYFANKELAELATPRIDSWTESVREVAGTLPITFNSISLYGFTDMVTFFKSSTYNTHHSQGGR